MSQRLNKSDFVDIFTVAKYPDVLKKNVEQWSPAYQPSHIAVTY